MRKRLSCCVAPLNYVGHEALRQELEISARRSGVKPAESFCGEHAGTVEHWLRNEHYRSDEEFVYAIAEGVAGRVQGDRDAASSCRSTTRIFRTAGRCTRL